MKDKILNSFSVNEDNEDIKVEVIKTEKGIVININGSTVDVKVNGDLIYSKFDNENYKYIPVNMRSFVEKNLCEWENDIVVEAKEVKCNIEFNGSEYYCILPKNKAKGNIVYFVNWLNSYKKISGYEVEIPNAEENFNKLIESIREVGYDLVYKWDGNEYDDSWGLKLSINDFSEKKVFQCFKLWEDYNNELEKYISKI